MNQPLTDKSLRSVSRPSIAAATGAVLGGEFEVVEALGSGSHADVFVAHQISVGRRRVAVKLLSQLYLTLSDGDFRRAASALIREAELLGSLHSACFVDVYCTGYLPDRRPYIAMELAVGPTLAQLMQKGTLTPAMLGEVLHQWAEGLAELHTLGYVHRDVTPANCVVATTAVRTIHAMTYDLGTASAISDKADRVRVGFDRDRPAGTPSYMSPEQASGGVIGPASDQFSLAAIVYEALSGRRPVPSDTGKAAAVLEYLRGTQPIPAVPLRTLRRDLAGDLADTVDRALSRDPSERFADVRDFAGAIDAGLAAAPTPGSTSLWSRIFKPKGRR